MIDTVTRLTPSSRIFPSVTVQWSPCCSSNIPGRCSPQRLQSLFPLCGPSSQCLWAQLPASCRHDTHHLNKAFPDFCLKLQLCLPKHTPPSPPAYVSPRHRLPCDWYTMHYACLSPLLDCKHFVLFSAVSLVLRILQQRLKRVRWRRHLGCIYLFSDSKVIFVCWKERLRKYRKI